MARRRLQIHLSTCVALVFAAGGLLWANMATRVFFFNGFPFVAFSDNQFDGEVSETYSEYMDSGLPEWRLDLPSGFVILPKELAWNLAIAVGTLVLTAFCCEILLPRLIGLYRRYVRFHFSTLLVVTLCSGALLLLNLREIEYPKWGAFEASTYTHHGWPWHAFATYDYDKLFIPFGERIEIRMESGSADGVYFWNFITPVKSVVVCPIETALNLWVYFILIALLAFVCETYARRRVQPAIANTVSPAPLVQSASDS
jgi:hypothetical protein